MPSNGTKNFATGPVTDTNVLPEFNITTDFYERGNKGDIKQISPRDEFKFFHTREKVIKNDKTRTYEPNTLSKNENEIIINNESSKYDDTDGVNEEQLEYDNVDTAQKSIDPEIFTFEYFVKKNRNLICFQIILFIILIVLLNLKYIIYYKLFNLCKNCIKAIYKKFCKTDTVKIHTENNVISKTVPENNNERLEGHMYFINGFNNNFIAD
ncbi:hypothetical protein COBT_002210 [Conglomerata obtusa]